MLLESKIAAVRVAADGEGARRQIARSIDEIVRRSGENARVRIIIGGDALSTETIATLISSLRKLRERGGAIELSAETDAVAAVIRLYGLDRVFAFPLVPQESGDGGDSQPCPPRRGRLGRVVRAAAFLFGLTALLPALPAPATADAIETDPVAILSHVMDRNPKLDSYQSRLHVDVRLISFPFIGQHLEASTYFKRPANYEVVFDRIPSYAKGFGKLYSDVGDPSNWQARFVITYQGTAPFENRTDIALHLVQRVRGMIDHETVLIDPGAWTIDQIRYDYYNGGVVTMTQHFAVIDGYTMLAAQRAEIKIPHVHAVADGTYTDYHTNVALSDALFTKKN